MPAPAAKIPRFELWWVRLPDQQGHHQTGRRPAVVVADEPDNGFTIVAPVTTNLERRRFKCTLVVEPSAENGLGSTSIVLGFQIRYLDRNRLEERMGQLSPTDQAVLDGLLAELLGFDG